MRRKDLREGWLATLKVGDEVAHVWTGHRKCRIVPVTRVLRDGSLRVDGLLFGPRGTWGDQESIVPVTPELRTVADRQARESLANRLLNEAFYRCKDLSDDALNALIAALQAGLQRKRRARSRT